MNEMMSFSLITNINFEIMCLELIAELIFSYKNKQNQTVKILILIRIPPGFSNN